MIEQAEGVEGVADDLGDGPGCDEEQHAILALHLHKQTEGVMGGTDRFCEQDLKEKPCCLFLDASGHTTSHRADYINLRAAQYVGNVWVFVLQTVILVLQ